jgi:hypothetical protein
MIPPPRRSSGHDHAEAPVKTSSNHRPWRIPGLRRLRDGVLSRRWAAFLVLGLAFFAFGVGTLNLFMLLRVNAELIAEHGWQAAMDGGLQQLGELLLTGYASMAAYLVAKVCEDSLVRQFGGTPETTRS